MKAGLRGVCLLLTVFCYAWAVRYAGIVHQRNHSVTVLLETDPQTSEDAKQIEKNEMQQERPLSFALWKQENEKTVENRELSRRSTVSVLSLWGNSQFLFRTGAHLEKGDSHGCLLDVQTARELFGTEQITGQKVRYGERELTVRGILKGVDPVLVCSAGEGQQLDRLTVEFPAGGRSSEVRDSFLVRHNIAGQVLKLETLDDTASFLTCLFPMIWGIGLLGKLARLGRYRKEGDGAGTWRIVCDSLVAAALAALLWQAAEHFRLPQDMIPAKWSDFGFWKNWWDQERESLLLLLLTEKQCPQQLWMKDFWSCVKFLGLAVVLAGILRKVPKGPENGEKTECWGGKMTKTREYS